VYMPLVAALRAKIMRVGASRRAQFGVGRAPLVEKGKKVKVAGAPTLKDLRKKLAKNNKRKDRLEKLFADDPAKKEAFDKLIAKAEKALDKAEDVVDKAEDKLDKAEDKLDKAEDKKDKAEDKKDKAEDKKDKAEDKKEKAKDKADDKKADDKKAG
jgi:chromosome segregation ATPase